MEGVTLGWASRACGGRLEHGTAADPVRGLAIDSRRVHRGELFFALRGERADGHAFVAEARRAGAAAAVCRRRVDAGPLILVRDPRRALGEIAAAYRRRFPRLRMAAVTGSSGKTVTKEMLAAVLGRRYRVLASAGNFNNDLGLPLTLARLSSRHTAAVVELGMNAPGEIRRLARWARPRVGVITNVGDAHLGRFPDRRALARAKAELLAELAPGGRAILNADDPQLARRAPGRRLTFGLSAGADVRVLGSEVRWSGTRVRLAHGRRQAAVALRALGAHQAWNAAAAVAAGLVLGVDFASACRALSGFASRAPMRLQVVRCGGGRVLHDAYNSNPQSAAAALALLAELPVRGRRYAVLGGMLELGRESGRAHRNLGHQAALAGLAGLVTVGAEALPAAEAAAEAGVRRVAHVPTAAAAAVRLAAWLGPRGDVVLVKGSRALGLERTVTDLRARWQG